MNNQELTLLTEGQIWGNNFGSQLKVLKKYGTKAAVTDLCILTGCDIYYHDHVDEDESLTGRTGYYCTKSNYNNNVIGVSANGLIRYDFACVRNISIRPVLQNSLLFSQSTWIKVAGYNGTEEIEYGEYPQNAAHETLQKELKENIVIITGFQGINDNNDITTLGRGGSDTTAVALAAVLHAD